MVEECKDGLFRVSIDTEVFEKKFFSKDEVETLFNKLERNIKEDIKKDIVFLQDEIKGEISSKTQKVRDKLIPTFSKHKTLR